ncbi:MAG TPA: hypothetical protein ENK76_02790 [Campylobacterales bacterium]|nr:hypothetical protein [Campylobacterales bacterium]
MKTDIKLITVTLFIFTATAYSKVMPIKSSIIDIKEDFFKTSDKSIKLKYINLIKPVSISLEGDIDFRKFFSKTN